VVNHREVRSVPFWLGFQKGIAKRMDEHFGPDRWRAAIDNRDPQRLEECRQFVPPTATGTWARRYLAFA
jgi:hypothetical protein